MIICICNNISQKDLDENPLLAQVIGSYCGKCIFEGGEVVSTNRSESIKDSPIDTVSIK